MKRFVKVTPIRLFLFICVIYSVGFFAHAAYLQKTVYGDGVYYFSWLHSIVIDHDINFSNEYAALGGSQPTTPLGHVGNKYSVGPALFWAPGYLFVRTLVGGDGYGFIYQLAAGCTSLGLTLVGLLLLWRLLTIYFSATVAIMTTAMVAGATNLLFYGSLDTVNSHALSFFATTFFLTLVLQRAKKNWFIIGATLGIIALMRPQDAIVGLLLIPYLNTKNSIASILGFFAVFFIQMTVWQSLYGQFWVSPYFSNIEGFHVLTPHISGVLFGIRSGLYLWTPATFLATVGLWLDATHRIPHKKIMAVICLLALYIVATWSTWWQGASYSGRMFVGILPLLAFGIASIFSWLATYKWTTIYYIVTILAPLSLLNAVSIVYFLLFIQ